MRAPRFTPSTFLSMFALASAAGSASIAAAAPVELLFAHYQGNVDRDPTWVDGSLAIESAGDAPGARRVLVHYRWRNEGDFSAWETSEARYEGPLSSDSERWVFETGRADLYYRGANFEFYFEYTVGGVQYFDDHGGANYKVGSGYLGSDFMWATLGQSRVIWLRGGMSRPDRASLSALVADLGQDKAVTFVYTTDGWATTHTADARYQYGFGAGAESWLVVFQFDGTPWEVEFAVRYDVDGATYWDNNFGRNYVLHGF